MLGGFIVSTLKLGFNPITYLRITRPGFHAGDGRDVGSGEGGGVRFPDHADGLLPRLVNSRGGAEGVGAATTAAVVSASILILAFDYVLTEMFFAR